ncbi:MAG: hypothetical protein LUD55_05185 [Oscillospiraceae bacterium]|nr:hypothetical protein [Oscillospiraceae bacterium]
MQTVSQRRYSLAEGSSIISSLKLMISMIDERMAESMKVMNGADFAMALEKMQYNNRFGDENHYFKTHFTLSKRGYIYAAPRPL